ncbi:hypothetical protein PGT21_021214 [Puccinia graminis f. sp. tritici]|uniref:Uncharacterized protein n=1 Tax=Puccinia graminis f. sp. tritici TaxID=56615 RepID=A0A5B0QGF8_PUCGR|nr:hypothetical protein PGT21_021214 [Puccinia graminis f. sp. tritici]
MTPPTVKILKAILLITLRLNNTAHQLELYLLSLHQMSAIDPTCADRFATASVISGYCGGGFPGKSNFSVNHFMKLNMKTSAPASPRKAGHRRPVSFS